MTQAELAGGFGVPTPITISGHIEDHYSGRVRAMPEPTQRPLVLASADPKGDATLLWRAASGRLQQTPSPNTSLTPIRAVSVCYAWG